MRGLQDYIYHFEEGRAKHWPRFAACALGVLLVALAYNWLRFPNLPTQEGMDCAQVARNIAEGNGFSTLFIRPLSVALLETRAATHRSWSGPLENSDPSRLNTPHPELANAPLYPLVLAGLMKILPFNYHIDLENRFWSMAPATRSADVEAGSASRVFRRYQPDFLISCFNQCVFLAVVVLTFFLARRLFDQSTAIISTLLLVGTDLLWRFTVSGLATLVLSLIFISLLWCLVHLEEEFSAAEDAPSGKLSAFRLAALAGALTGLGAMTQYAFAWLILPVVGFACFVSGPRRVAIGLVTSLSFLIVVAPWLIRNYLLSGAPFGIAGYSVLEGTSWFPVGSLQRSLSAGAAVSSFAEAVLAWRKLLFNGLHFLQSDLPRLGGTWVSGFFLLALVLPGGTPRAKRFGFFIVACLAILALAQIECRTHLSDDSPDVNSENLLVLLVPVIWIYGTSLLLSLLKSIESPANFTTNLLVAAFVVFTCLPMPLSLLAVKRSPGVFRPSYPPWIQSATAFVKKGELMMSDVPWAVAWYGHTQCAWLTGSKREFFIMNDRLKPIQALFLTHAGRSDSAQSFDRWLRAGDENWGELIINCLCQKDQGKAGPPADFPLEFWQKGWPNYFLLTSREKAATGSD